MRQGNDQRGVDGDFHAIQLILEEGTPRRRRLMEGMGSGLTKAASQGHAK